MCVCTQTGWPHGTRSTLAHATHVSNHAQPEAGGQLQLSPVGINNRGGPPRRAMQALDAGAIQHSLHAAWVGLQSTADALRQPGRALGIPVAAADTPVGHNQGAAAGGAGVAGCERRLPCVARQACGPSAQLFLQLRLAGDGLTGRPCNQDRQDTNRDLVRAVMPAAIVSARRRQRRQQARGQRHGAP